MTKLKEVFRSKSGRSTMTAAMAFAAVTAVAFDAHAQGTQPAAGKSVKVGSGIYELVASPSAGVVYVASAGARQEPTGAAVIALNAETLDVVKTIDMASAPPYGIALNDRTQTLYTTNTRVRSMSAVNLATGAITEIKAEGDTSGGLREIVVDETTNTIYASSYSNQGKIWVIDGTTNKVAHLIENVGDGTSGMVLDTAAGKLYAANMTAGDIVVIDTKTRQLGERFSAGGGERPANLAFDPATGRLFVANQGGTATVLDTKAGGKVLATVNAGAGALDIEFHPQTNRIFVANRGAGSVTVIDGTSYQVVSQLETGGAPNTLTLDTKTGVLYVSKKVVPQPRAGGPGQQAGAPAAAPAPPPADPNGDTVQIIRP